MQRIKFYQKIELKIKMLKILKKIEFKAEENKMKSVADTITAKKIFHSRKSNNLRFLLEQRFRWMNNFIERK